MINVHIQANPIGLENLPPRFWVYERDARGLAVTARSLGGWVLRVERDARFRWQQISDSISLLARREYDEFGNEIEVRDAHGVVCKTRYDDLHRPLEVIRNDSEVTRYKWNGTGHMTERMRPGDQREAWQYDQNGNLVAITNALGDTIRMEYDTEGNLTAIVNRLGERLEYRRDAEGRIVEEKLFDGRIQSYEYDLRGRRVKIELSDGRTVTQRFDPAGNLVCREASDGLVEEFAYDKEGRVIKAWNSHSTVELRRDLVGRIIAEVQNGRPVTYRLDHDGNRIHRSLPLDATGSQLICDFDRRGRLVALEDERGLCQEIRWDNVDRLVERRCLGQVKELFTYDAQRRLYEQRVESRDGEFIRTHTYDAAGNLVGLHDKRQDLVEYVYDRANRLTEVRKGGTLVEAYEYDANDALRATHRGRRSVGPGGKILEGDSRELAYAGDGAVAAVRTGKSTRILKHDVNGRLVEVVRHDGTVCRYEYDPFGRRTAKVVGDDRTEFLWEGKVLAAELRGNGEHTIHLCPELRPLGQWSRGVRLTPILDQRAAVRELYDASGRRRWSCALDAYGSVVSATGDIPNPFRLRGQFQDAETGLYYNFSRHYDPEIGDYTAADPIGVEGGNHFYAYPRNPLRWDDPYGLECPDGKDPRYHAPDDPLGPPRGPGPDGRPVRADFSSLDEDELEKVIARGSPTDRKGRSIWGQGRVPTEDEFDGQIVNVRAGDLRSTLDARHVEYPDQKDYPAASSNDELTQFRPHDPISGKPRNDGSGVLGQTGGHHRAAEIDRRTHLDPSDPNYLDPDTPVPVVVHD
jgi:RHS repeat-associated protein